MIAQAVMCKKTSRKPIGLRDIFCYVVFVIFHEKHVCRSQLRHEFKNLIIVTYKIFVPEIGV